MNDLQSDSKFRFDPEKCILERDGKLVPLPHKALEVLKLLIERHGEIVSKDEIFDTVWSNAFVEEGVLTQNIYTLRKTLGKNQDGSHKIENIARRGYRLAKLDDIELTSSPESNRIPEVAGPKSKVPGLPIIAFGSLVAVVILGLIGYSLVTSRSEADTGRLENASFKQLTDTGDASYLTISPAGDRVAYSRDSGLYVKDLASNHERKVEIENSPRFGCVQFSADGKSVFFGTLSNRDIKGSVFRASLEGGRAEEIASNVWSGFSISPNGEKIAFVRKSLNENRQYLILKDLGSGAETQLTSISLPEEFYWNNYPAWSADGGLIAMVAVKQTEHFSRIVIVDMAGKTRDFKPEGFRNIEQVVWSADSSSFIAAANDGKNFQIWKISLSGGGSNRLTNDLNSYLGIGVSADRKSLVSRQRIYYSNIWIAAKDSPNELRQLTTGSGRNDGLRGLAWLDENRLIYTSNDERIRDWNLWSLNVADGSRTRLTNESEIQNDHPSISRVDGSIYFSSDRNKANRIWRIDANGANAKQITFGEDETHHFPQVSPDGQWLYFLIRSGRSSTIGRRSLVDNSMQELTGKADYTAGNFLSLSPDGQNLAFQNIDIVKNPNPSPLTMQIAVLSTSDPEKVVFREVEAWQQKAKWSVDAATLDFIGGDIKNSRINRLFLSEGMAPQEFLTSRDSVIFDFAWSPSGEKIAIARGQLLRDVVLLTNFDR